MLWNKLLSESEKIRLIFVEMSEIWEKTNKLLFKAQINNKLKYK